MIVSDEEFLPAARGRVLGVCYDIRHVLMGNRDYTFVPNGLTHEIKKYQKFAASDNNVYLKRYTFFGQKWYLSTVREPCIF